MENKIIMTDENGNEIELFILDETKINGMNYILTTDAPEGEDGECYVLKDISKPEETDAVYRFVDNDDELEYMTRIFSELSDDDTEVVFEKEKK